MSKDTYHAATITHLQHIKENKLTSINRGIIQWFRWYFKRFLISHFFSEVITKRNTDIKIKKRKERKRKKEGFSGKHKVWHIVETKQIFEEWTNTLKARWRKDLSISLFGMSASEFSMRLSYPSKEHVSIYILLWFSGKKM